MMRGQLTDLFGEYGGARFVVLELVGQGLGFCVELSQLLFRVCATALRILQAKLKLRSLKTDEDAGSSVFNELGL